MGTKTKMRRTMAMVIVTIHTAISSGTKTQHEVKVVLVIVVSWSRYNSRRLVPHYHHHCGVATFLLLKDSPQKPYFSSGTSPLATRIIQKEEKRYRSQITSRCTRYCHTIMNRNEYNNEG